MTTHNAMCLICEWYQNVDSYDDWKCKQGGQQYKYDEGHSIVLDDEQLAILRGLNKPVDDVI